jgi:hypothetical protein
MKRVVLVLALITVAALCSAVDISDPRDPLYGQLDTWAARGYITRLPLLRPYPAQLIVSLLRDVSSRGDRASAASAKELLAAIDVDARLRVEAYSESRAANDEVYTATGGYLTAGGKLDSYVTVAGRFGAVVVAEPGNVDAFLPGEGFPADYDVDWSDVTVAGIRLLPTLSGAGTAAIGTDRFWFQIGVNRHSFGPFDEGPVLSPQAAQAGHLSVTWRGPGLTYSEFLLVLAATSDRGDAIKSNGDITVYPNKYLTGQSFQFSPFSWLDIGLFETVVYGERFDPLYLAPAVPRTYLSINEGSIDNLMLGFSTQARMPSDLGFDFMFYADDMHFVDMLSFNFDTKYKVSFQGGLSWTPLRALIRRVNLDYALVTPYTYTHRRESITGVEEDGFPDFYANGINYYNYSHAGRSLVALDPNSDRLRLRAMLAPMDRVNVVLAATFQRHANATESNYTDSWAVGTADGGINDNGYDPDGNHLFDKVSFLTQDVIEKILLLGFTASWDLPLGPGRLSVDGGYTLELAWNKRGNDTSMGPVDWEQGQVPIKGNDVVIHHVSLGLRYAY